MEQREYEKNGNRCQGNGNWDNKVDIIFPTHSIFQRILFAYKIALNKREMEGQGYRVHQNLSQEYIRRIRQLLSDGGYIGEKGKN